MLHPDTCNLVFVCVRMYVCTCMFVRSFVRRYGTVWTGIPTSTCMLWRTWGTATSRTWGANGSAAGGFINITAALEIRTLVLLLLTGTFFVCKVYFKRLANRRNENIKFADKVQTKLSSVRIKLPHSCQTFKNYGQLLRAPNCSDLWTLIASMCTRTFSAV